jgi:hypothetical protein
MCVMLTGVLLGAVFVDRADAGDGRKGSRDRRAVARYEYRSRDVRYLPARDVVVIRDYYRPHYRPLPPGLAKRYYRTGYLPRGWERRVRPVPVYVERDLYRLPRGYRRGVIDGHAVVYNGSGMIIDVAVLF